MLGFEIRECKIHEEFDQCIELQRAIWTYRELDVMPHHAYIITRNSGGFTLGAFTPEGRLVGFVHTWLARRDGAFCFYSHMLAVTQEWQSQGIGGKLKFAQREEALRRGAERIVWTFDPLQARNANFNINRLGVTAGTYEVNYYGTASSSPLHRGLETDRLFVDWWLNSPRVLARLQGKELSIERPVAQIQIPGDIVTLKRSDVDAARRTQLAVREQFLEHLRAGLRVTGFKKEDNPGGSAYLLSKDE